MEAFYFSPMLLGVNLILAVAIAATALWFMARPLPGPAYWMSGAWLLVGGVLLFFVFVLTRNPVVNVIANTLQLAGEAVLLLGIFRFLGRPLPWWIVPVSAGLIITFNTHYWLTGGNSDFLMMVYSLIAGLLPLQAVCVLLCFRDEPATRPARVLVGVCLAVYSLVTLARGWFAGQGWLLDEPYEQPFESFGYLLPYNFAIPALVMGFIGMVLMSMQRILAGSRANAEQARQNALRFERLLNVSSAGMAVLKDGRLSDANAQLEALTGRRREQLLGLSFEELFPRRARGSLPMLLHAADGSLVDIDIRRQDGSSFPGEARIIPLDEEGPGDVVVEVRDISHRREMEEELKRLATVDPLTGALNRRSFNELFARSLKQTLRQRSALCLAVLDLDHFKIINDVQGHQAGDDALRQFSQMCLREARSTDIFARFGGEEFVLVLPDTDIEGARIILQRLLDGAGRLSMWGARGAFNCQVSAGVAALREGDTLDTLLQRADRALYMAKDKGRNRVEVAD